MQRVFKNILKVSFFTLISRILGLTRDTIIAFLLGSSLYSDAFFVALKLPNIFRRLFAEGSLNSVFVPLFSGMLSVKEEEKAKDFAGQILSLLFLGLLITTVLIEVFMPQVLTVITPGFKKHYKDTFDVAVMLSRITLPYLFLVALSTLFVSILNSYNFFSLGAILPIFFNVGIIVGFLLGHYFIPDYVSYGGALGVTLGGVLQLLLTIYYIKDKKINIKFGQIKHLTANTKEFFKKLVPIIFGSGIYHVNIFIDLMIASFLPAGSISYLFYADRLNQLPLALIGIAISTVILPFISRKNESAEEIQEIKKDSLIFGFTTSLAATVGLIFLGQEIVNLIFKHGKFLDDAAKATYFTLVAYSFSLVSNVLIKILVVIFYSKGDTKRPLYINIITMVLNILLAIILSYFFSYVGIALSTSIASLFSLGVLLFILIKENILILNKEFFKEVSKGIIASVILMVWLLATKKIIYVYMDYNKFIFNMTLLFIIALGILFWGWSLKYMKSSVYKKFIRSFVRK